MGQKGPQVPSSHLACITESCTYDIVVICLAAPQAKLVWAVFPLKIMCCSEINSPFVL